MRRIGLGSAKAIGKPSGRSIRTSSNLTVEERHAVVYSTTAWQRLRKLVRDHWPTCVACGCKADLVDHIVPVNIAPDRAHDITNLQPACRRCHEAKTRDIDAPGGFAANYNWNRAKTEADKRPEAMKRWAAEMQTSGAVERLIRPRAFDGEVTC